MLQETFWIFGPFCCSLKQLDLFQTSMWAWKKRCLCFNGSLKPLAILIWIPWSNCGLNHTSKSLCFSIISLLLRPRWGFGCLQILKEYMKDYILWEFRDGFWVSTRTAFKTGEPQDLKGRPCPASVIHSLFTYSFNFGKGSSELFLSSSHCISLFIVLKTKSGKWVCW